MNRSQQKSLFNISLATLIILFYQNCGGSMAGHQNQLASTPLSVNDTTSPLITSLKGPNDCVSGACENQISFSIVENESGIDVISCKLNGQSILACSSPYTIASSELTNSTTTAKNIKFEIQVTDKAGNSSALQSHNFTISPPTVTPPPPPPPPVAAGAPTVLYTDIASGPNSGGEGNNGAYLSIFGKNFGSSLAGLQVKIGGAAVARVISLGVSRARPDIQMIVTQIGSLANPPLGQELPIQVTNSSGSSNTDKTFIVNPGLIYFVDPVNGNDATGVAGDITKPFKLIQSSNLSAGTWGKIKAGDTLVLRAGEIKEVGFESYFMRFWFADKTSGKKPTGQAGTGPIALIGYPGEDAFINCPATLNPNGCLSGLNAESFPSAGQYITIANLRIEGGGYDGPISQQVNGDNWRIVNNEITAFTGVTTGANPSRMGGITGGGLNAFWLGNHIHDIQGSANEAHGIYIDSIGTYEVAYNNIHDIKSGKGIQFYSTKNPRANVTNKVNIHHNIVHDVNQFGINLASSATVGFWITNNVIYNSRTGGLRLDSGELSQLRVYNNTFYNNNTSKISGYGTIMTDSQLGASTYEIKNNIFYATAGTSNLSGSVGFSSGNGLFSNNLWFNGNDGVSFDTAAVTADPKFINMTGDFHLNSGSPAIDKGSSSVGVSNVLSPLVNTDYDLSARPTGAGYDIGAFEK